MTQTRTTTEGSSRSEALVSVRGVDKQYANGTLAISGIDLEVNTGEFVSLVGPAVAAKAPCCESLLDWGKPPLARF